GRINTWRTEIIEKKLSEENKTKSYQFLNDCDNLIKKIRIPRGKLRNMVRKEGKEVNSKLMDSTEKFNVLFDEIQKISYDFVEEINKSKIDKFEDFFEKFNTRIKQNNEKIPTLKREIRKFGIY
ncbi:MAG: hypothetical protein ACW96X_01550, partial [Promethearchaeota archaeon]